MSDSNLAVFDGMSKPVSTIAQRALQKILALEQTYTTSMFAILSRVNLPWDISFPLWSIVKYVVGNGFAFASETARIRSIRCFSSCSSRGVMLHPFGRVSMYASFGSLNLRASASLYWSSIVQ